MRRNTSLSERERVVHLRRRGGSADSLIWLVLGESIVERDNQRGGTERFEAGEEEVFHGCLTEILGLFLASWSWRRKTAEHSGKPERN